MDKWSYYEVACQVGADAMLILDQAGWDGAKGPQGSKQHLDLAAATTLAGAQSSGKTFGREFMRQNWLSNRVFKIFNDKCDLCYCASEK